MTTRTLTLRLSALLALSAATLQAQVGETRISLVVSPVYLPYSAAFGGGTGAVAGDLRVTRYFTRYLGAQLAGRVVLPRTVMSAMPACDPTGALCESRSSPSAITAGVASLLGVLGETGLRASLGIGQYGASGYKNGGDTQSNALGAEIGAEWVPSGRSRFTPVFGMRVVRLASPIAGMRQMYLPGVGIGF